MVWSFCFNVPDPSDPKNVFSQESSAKWVHLVWVFDTEMDALSFAISLLDDPLITSNEWLLESAIHQLEENRFYQVGRESVAIAEVQESPVIVYEDELNEDIKDEQKSIH